MHSTMYAAAAQEERPARWHIIVAEDSASEVQPASRHHAGIVKSLVSTIQTNKEGSGPSRCPFSVDSFDVVHVANRESPKVTWQGASPLDRRRGSLYRALQGTPKTESQVRQFEISHIFLFCSVPLPAFRRRCLSHSSNDAHLAQRYSADSMTDRFSQSAVITHRSSWSFLEGRNRLTRGLLGGFQSQLVLVLV